MVNHARMQGKNALDALPEADLPDRDTLAHTGVFASDHGAFERLQTLLVTFIDLAVQPDRIAGAHRRHFGPAVLLNKLSQKWVIHFSIPSVFPIVLDIRSRHFQIVPQ